MVRLQTTLIALSIFVTCFHSVSGQENGDETPQTIENTSLDGRFAFRNTGDSDSEKQTYDLIDKGSGKVLKSVAESDPDLGPSARFNMSVLWRSDSKAFALTATLIKLGSEVSVYLQEGTTFRKIKLPKLSADIPEKIKRGKSFPHVSELDSWARSSGKRMVPSSWRSRTWWMVMMAQSRRRARWCWGLIARTKPRS